MHSTIKRYLIQAWRALATLGFDVKHPKETGCLAIVKSMGVGIKFTPKPKRAYCSIRWEYILTWKQNLPWWSRLDKIALAVVALAFMTIRRLGSFVPRSQKEAEEFT